MENLRSLIGSLYGGSVKRFASDVGVHPQAIYKYLSGERTPRPKVARQIVSLTGGKITLNDLMGIPLEQEKKRKATKH